MIQSEFHCGNCTLASVRRQTDITTTGWGYYSQPEGNFWASTLPRGPADCLGWGCGIESEERMGCSEKKLVGIWFGYPRLRRDWPRDTGLGAMGKRCSGCACGRSAVVYGWAARALHKAAWLGRERQCGEQPALHHKACPGAGLIFQICTTQVSTRQVLCLWGRAPEGIPVFSL